MTCAFTKAELVLAALQSMSVVGADGSVSADDDAYVSRLYDAKHAEWADRNLVYWPNTGRSVEEIPPAVFAAVRDLVINEAEPAYGKSKSVAERSQTEEFLLKRLRRHTRRDPSGLPTRVNTY
jgi:hypothetical protein